MRVVKLKLGLLSIMAGAVITSGLIGLNGNSVYAATLQANAAKTEYLHQPIAVSGGNQRVIMKLRGVDLRDLLRSLATRAGFNILMDESVDGSISVDLNNVTIDQALDTVKDYANLVYMQDEKTLVVSSKDSELSQSINQQVSQMIPVKYVNAKLIADILNSTLFSASGEQDTASAKKATAEYRTNTVFVVGTDNDVRLASEIKNIDVPRQSKTFRINHANVVDVAQLLQATIFNDGVAPYDSTGSGDGDRQLKSSAISVVTETFQEGSGTEEVQGASGDGGGGTQQTFSLRTKIIEAREVKINPEGPLIVPDSRSSTLTIMGTVEQIALAEAVIPTLDQKLPQVAIEASLIEVSESSMKNLEVLWGQQGGQWGTGFNNSSKGKGAAAVAGDPAFQPLADLVRTTVDQNGNIVSTTYENALGPLSQIIGLPTLRGEKPINANGLAAAFSTSPLNITRSNQFLFQINAMVSQGKAKLLANPTVMAVHNSEAVISITEEVVRRTTVTRDATGFTQTQVEIGEAGIILDIIPKVSGDGYVNLRIRPSVSSVAQQIIKDDQNITTLLRRKDLAVQEVRLVDGQTLAIGGLIDERSQADHSKIPGLADLPIVGTLFRTSANDRERNELLMLVTPRIVQDDRPLISSSFQQAPVTAISNNEGRMSAPVPTKRQEIEEDVYDIEPVEVTMVTDVKPEKAKPQEVVDVPVRKAAIKPVQKTEKRVNAYTIEDVMREFGISDKKLQKDNVSIDKSEIDKLLDEYLPKGSN